MNERVLDEPPATWPMLLRAALPVVPGANRLPGIRRSATELPDLRLVRHEVPVERAHVDAYAEVCAFPRRDTVPLTYPHVLAFAMHLALMTDRTFPYPAVGTVHLENSITRHHPVRVGDRLSVTVWAGGLRSHPKGHLFDLHTEISVGDKLAWEETSTMLRRGAGDPAAPESEHGLVDIPAGATRWRLGAGLGRRYASVSGDHNPIHLYKWSAKAFGFPRQIAHGMWTQARCLAALEGRLPDRVRVDVAFKKPVLLPGTVSFGSRREADGYAFSLRDAHAEAPHLLGRLIDSTDG
jgi:acyl dehydratase